jgi:hypothetical protein
MSRISILLTLIVTAQTYAQPGKLIDAGAPCKLLSDNADVFLVEQEGKNDWYLAQYCVSRRD